MPKLKPLSEQVVVVTGASSGIGLATARMAAQGGAAVVLAARSASALDGAARDIEAAGGRALAVVADVGSREDVERVAAEAVARFGRIDAWVNNAGVGIWGRIEEVSEADMRRLFDTNFWGTVYGSLAALPHLKREGGALINVGSMASDRAIPLQGIYSASKHAIKGFTDALRSELDAEGAPVSVTLVKPASIGTPLPQHVRNYTGQEAKLPPPVYAPKEVAKVILRAATHPTRDAFVGGAARAISLVSQVAPRAVDLLGASVGIGAQLGPKPATPTDNLWEGRAEGEVYGDAQGSIVRPSLYTAAARHPGLSAALAGTALGAAALLLRRRAGGKAEAATNGSGVVEVRTVKVVVEERPSERPGGLDDLDSMGGADDLLASDGLVAGGMADAPMGDAADDGREFVGISDGVNARPLEDTISQSAPGLPDDSGLPVEIDPEEEARIAERIRSL